MSLAKGELCELKRCLEFTVLPILYNVAFSVLSALKTYINPLLEFILGF